MCMLTELFCKVDDFCLKFEQDDALKIPTEFQPIRSSSCMISISEIITLLIYFHQIRYWHFKIFYTFPTTTTLYYAISVEFYNFMHYYHTFDI